VANLWRTTGDVQNTWASVMGNIHSQNDMASVAEPGHFNDPE
jgi:alpha-galactosidase